MSCALCFSQIFTVEDLFLEILKFCNSFDNKNWELIRIPYSISVFKLSMFGYLRVGWLVVGFKADCLTRDLGQ